MAKTFKQRILVTLEDKASKGAKKVSSSMKGMAKSVLAAGAAFFGAKAIISGLQQSVALSQKHEALSRPFTTLNKAMGGSSQALAKYSKAVDGTVNEMELMMIANQAMTLGVVDSEQGMAELFDTAQRLGKSLGVDTVSAIDSLVTGMGRQSVLMLDNLGIIVDTQKAYDDYAKSLGKASSALTDQEKKLAFNEAALDSAKDKVSILGDEQLTSSDTFNQLSVTMSEFATKIGTQLTPMLQGMANALMESVEWVTDTMVAWGLLDSAQDKIIKNYDKQIFQVGSLFSKLRDTNTEEDERVRIIKELNGIYPEFNLSLSEELKSTEALAKAEKELVDALEKKKGFEVLEATLEDVQEDLGDTIDDLGEFRRTFLDNINRMSEIDPKFAITVQRELDKLGPSFTTTHDLMRKDAEDSMLFLQGIYEKIVGDSFTQIGKSTVESGHLVNAGIVFVGGLIQSMWKDTENSQTEILKSFQFTASEYEKLIKERIDLVGDEADSQDTLTKAGEEQKKMLDKRNAPIQGAINLTEEMVAAQLEEINQLNQLKDGYILYTSEKAIDEAMDRQLIASGTEKFELREKEIQQLKDLKTALSEYVTEVQEGFTGEDEEFEFIDNLTLANDRFAESLFEGATAGDKFNATLGLMKAHAKSSKEGISTLTDEHVYAAMAIGAAAKSTSDAARNAASIYIASAMQEAIAGFIKDAFNRFGIFGGVLGVAASAVVGNIFSRNIQNITAAEGMNEVVTEPTLILAGEAGPEYVDIEPTTNEGAGRGGGVNISFTGNVLSSDFIENEAVPLIKEALRKGADIGIS